MQSSEISTHLSVWSESKAVNFYAWVDDANVMFHRTLQGVRCSISILDFYDTQDVRRLELALWTGQGRLGCDGRGALGIDPDQRNLVLVAWIQAPWTVTQLLVVLEDLANHRATCVELVNDIATGKIASPFSQTPFRGLPRSFTHA